MKMPLHLFLSMTALFAWIACSYAIAAQWVDGSRVRVGVPRHFPPQYQTDNEGLSAGFAIDVMEQIGKLADLSVVYQVYDRWPDLFRALRTGEVDIIPNLGISDDRRLDFAYTAPIETFALRIFVRSAADDIAGIEDVKWRNVASVEGNISIDFMKQIEDIDVVVFNEVEQALFALLASKVDAMIYPQPWVERLAELAGVDDRIKIVGEPLLEVQRALAVRADNEVLLERLSGAVNSFLMSEEYQRIYAKWYGKSNSFWTVQKLTWGVIVASVIVVILVVVGMAIWHYRSLVIVNRQLSKTVVERQQARMEKEESERKYKILFDSAGDAIFIMRQERLIDCNSKLLQHFRVQRAGFIGKTTNDFSPAFQPDGQPSLQKAMAITRAAYAGQPQFFEWLCKRLDGTQFYCELNLARIRVNGEFLLQGIFRDITERKQADNALMKQRSYLEDMVINRTRALELSNQELEAFSYSIAHDLRSPLRTVAGFSQILVEDTSKKLNEQELGYLNRIIDSSKHMAQLIDDILDLSRISRSDLNVEEVNLSELAQSVMVWLQEMRLDRIINWKIQSGLCVKGDSRLLECAMQNLLVNAWKYTSKVEQAEIEFGRYHDNPNIFFVKDNGAGFDMKYADKLFKPFQRLHSKEDFKGTGVGLATVWRIMQRHGGKVWADAEPDRGAVFYFTL